MSFSVNYGTGMCDVTRKFLYQSAEQATDLAREDFMARKKLIERAYWIYFSKSTR